jgi:hypothetical protein
MKMVKLQAVCALKEAMAVAEGNSRVLRGARTAG